MTAVAVVGGQWGDEGKGKIVDMLAEKAHLVARYSGGSNAGHTVVNQYGEFRLHLAPSGIFHPGVTCVIGNGVVVNPAELLAEIASLKRVGLPVTNLVISDRAHVVMPYHVQLDGLEEQARGGAAIGTTLRGIGPAFMDKTGRMGIRMGDLIDPTTFHQRLKAILPLKNRLLTQVYGAEPLDLDQVYTQYLQYGQQLAPYVRETQTLLQQTIEENKSILLEGAQGTMLDIDFGTYPYVTSSSPTVGGACCGFGIAPSQIHQVIGVFKAYTTRVGGGPFPTELRDEICEQIRQRGQEYGAVTGRPRRCGWFDGVAGRYSARINGLTGIALTRLDILDAFNTVKICVAYRLNGETITHFPSNLGVLERCQPVYEELEGWESPIGDLRGYQELPVQAKTYVKRLEEVLDCPVAIISVGPRREATIGVRSVF